MTLDSCSLCRVLVSDFVLWFLVFDFHVFVSFHVVSYVLIFHALIYPVSVSYVLPSVSLCLSVFLSLPSPCYLTCWSTSPVPRLFISVYLVSVFPSLLVQSLYSVCMHLSASCSCSCSCSCLRLVLSSQNSFCLQSSLGMRFWTLSFAFGIF